MYLFGGMDQKGHLKNDLWLIEPYYPENDKVLSSISYEYQTRIPFLSISIKRVDSYSGKPPCPRIYHSACLFKDWNKHNLLFIYGGRNDEIYAQTHNVALNDVCIFNINKSEWQTLAMYGQIPCSRWSHICTLNRGGSNSIADGFLIFGGVNLKNYCRSRIYQFQILNSWYKPAKGVKLDNKINQKLEMLFNNVKEKIEIIKEQTNKKV